MSRQLGERGGVDVPLEAVPCSSAPLLPRLDGVRLDVQDFTGVAYLCRQVHGALQVHGRAIHLT